MESIFPSGGTTTAHTAGHTGWPPASGMASTPPSWHLYYRLLGITFCDRKTKFPVLLCLVFARPSEHVLILLFPDQPAVSSGHTGTICSEGRSFTPWCKPQSLIDTSLIVSHKHTQTCSWFGGSSLVSWFDDGTNLSLPCQPRTPGRTPLLPAVCRMLHH